MNNTKDKTDNTDIVETVNDDSNNLQAVDNNSISANDQSTIQPIKDGNRVINIQNLKPVRTKEEARIRGRNGGIKSGEVRRQKKTMRETLQDALQIELSPDKLQELGADMTLINGNTSVLSAIVASTIREAINGDTKAIQFVRDSIGEQPKQEIVQEVITKEDIELIDDLKNLLSS